MDSVRSLLLTGARQPLPSFVPDATLVNISQIEPADREIAKEQVRALLVAGHRVYLHVHEIQTRLVRDDLLAFLTEGIYGVSLPGLAGLNQLKYIDSLLEDVERRAGIPEGLTAIGAWIDSAKGMVAVNEIAAGSSRLTWMGIDHGSLAAEIGVDTKAESTLLEYAWYTVGFAARANDLPAVNGIALDLDADSAIKAATLARLAGLSGMLTPYEKAAARFNEIFPEPSTETEINSDDSL